MTWNREEAMRLAEILDASIGAVPAPVFAQARYDAARQLKAAVAEIDRRDRVNAGRERLTDTIDKLTAEQRAGRQQLTEATEAIDFANRMAAAQSTDLAAARQRIAELENRVARQKEWLRWPNHNMHEPVAKLYTEHFPDGDLRRTGDRFHAVIDKLTKERDAALVRVKELEAERASAAGEVLINVADMPPGSTLGKVVIANRLLKHENQNLREHIAELEAEVGRIQNIERLRIASDTSKKLEHREEQIDAIADALGDDSDWSNLSDRGDNALEAANCLRSDLAAAQQRSAELEDAYHNADDDLRIARKRIAELERGLDRDRRHLAESQAILRAIYPVYRAAVAYEAAKQSHGELKVAMHTAKNDREYRAATKAATPAADAKHVTYRYLQDVVDTARDALTPDLVAALKAAGVEEP